MAARVSRPIDGDGGPRRAAGGGVGHRIRTAAATVADHAELWWPGSLASLPFLGWLPFVLAVVPFPSQADLAFFGTSVITSASFPINVILLSCALALVLVAASVLVATGEAALQRTARRIQGSPPLPTSLDDDAARLWLVQLIAAVPALAGVALVAAAIVGVGPGEYQSPDLGTPLVVRIARDIWPFLAAEGALIVVGQAIGGLAQRATLGGRIRPLAAIGVALRTLARQPVLGIGLPLAGDLVLAAWLILNWALLRVLWLPIGQAASHGDLLGPGWVLLLVGFVAIWVCLIAAGGALQAWISGWWTDGAEDAGWS